MGFEDKHYDMVHLMHENDLGELFPDMIYKMGDFQVAYSYTDYGSHMDNLSFGQAVLACEDSDMRHPEDKGLFVVVDNKTSQIAYIANEKKAEHFYKPIEKPLIFEIVDKDDNEYARAVFSNDNCEEETMSLYVDDVWGEFNGTLKYAYTDISYKVNKDGKEIASGEFTRCYHLHKDIREEYTKNLMTNLYYISSLPLSPELKEFAIRQAMEESKVKGSFYHEYAND